jgi:hypothetical protein
MHSSFLQEPVFLLEKYVRLAGMQFPYANLVRTGGGCMKLQMACPYCRNAPDQRSSTKPYTRCAALFPSRDGRSYWFKCQNCGIGSQPGVNLRTFMKTWTPSLYRDFVLEVIDEQPIKMLRPADTPAERAAAAKDAIARLFARRRAKDVTHG